MKTLIAPAIVLLAAGAARADEGMWTFNHFPKATVGSKYKFTPDDKWLEHVRLSSVRLAGGCSGSFVSENGLVMTNHHCAHSCIAQLSTAQKDYVKSGFYAKTEADEVKCPEIEINQLVEITDVTAKVTEATKGLDGEKYTEARKAIEAKLEKECATNDKVRCDVVSLYHGGEYDLYKYARHQDVRLVFAPELASAFFGGDPDNFNFPRFDMDISLLRVYEDGKPIKLEHYFKWSAGGAKEGELTFVSGHPGGTDRQLTVAQLEYQRDVALPDRLLVLAQARGMFTEFGRRGAEQKRISTDDLFGIENSFKALKGRYEALLDPKLFNSKVSDEKAFRALLAKKPDKAKKYLPAYDAIAKATIELKNVRKQLQYVAGSGAFRSDLFGVARTLVRAADELQKPNEKRLEEFHESSLPQMKQRLFSARPIYDEKEILWLTFSLTKMREDLGADDPFVKKVLGVESPEELATRLVKSTKLKDIALRKKVWEGGAAALTTVADDPMIKMARLIDGDARAVRKHFEDDIDAVLRKNSELIAKAKFELQGTSNYPDATFTLRLSFGQVKGWLEGGKPVKPFTDFGGAFARATGRPPFDLPQSWLDSKAKLELATPLNFVTTNDIIGGNSGSPMVNKDAQVVGLIFDGNIESLGGEYGFDESVNRAVAVHSEGIIHALGHIYHADRVVNELRPVKSATR
jgi:V8-like Glu-specific endopeptidase